VSPDGAHALSGSFDNSVGLWSSDGSETLYLEGHEAAVNAVAFAGSSRIVSAGDDFSIRVWDRVTGSELHLLEGHKGKIMSL